MAIEVGSVSVDVVPNVERFRKQVEAETAKLKKVEVGIDLNDKDAQARIAALVHKRTVEFHASADTKAAQAQLALLEKRFALTTQHLQLVKAEGKVALDNLAKDVARQRVLLAKAEAAGNQRAKAIAQGKISRLEQRADAIKAELQLDTAKVQAQYSALARDIAAQKIEIEASIRVDDEVARLQIDALVRDHVTQLEVEADDEAARATLDELSQDRNANIHVTLRGAQEAEREMRRAAASRTAFINAQARLAKAQADLAAEANKERNAIFNAELRKKKAELEADKFELRKRTMLIRLSLQTAEAERKARELSRPRIVRFLVNFQTRDLQVAHTQIGRIVIASLALGSALIPLAGFAVAAFGAIAFGATVAAGAMGVLGLAFFGVFDALRLMGQAERDAALDAAQTARAQQAAAQAIASAQSGLVDAEAALASARRSAAEAAIQSAQRVAAAQRGVRDAARNAAEATASAMERLATAERALANAQRDAVDAQRDLTEARLDARRAIEDLNNAIIDGALSEREANLALQEAKERLDALESPAASAEDALIRLAEAQDALVLAQMNPQGTESQLLAAQIAVDAAQAQVDAAKGVGGDADDSRERAELAVERAAQNLAEIQLRNKRLAEDKKKSDKDGVEGSEQVVAAQQRILDTLQAQKDAQDEVADSADDLIKTRRDGAEDIALAEAEVTEAIRLQGVQAIDSAESIEAAQRQVADAQRVLTAALEKDTEAAITAADRLQAAMDQLPEAAQDFVRFLHELQPALDTLRETAAGFFFPGLQAGIEALLPLLPTFNRLVGIIAEGMGHFFEEFGKALAGPEFADFWKFLEKNLGPNMDKFTRIFINFAEAFVDLLIAFAPFTDEIVNGLLEFSEAVRDFASGKTGKLQEFLGWLEEHWPQIMQFFRDLPGAVVRVITAFAPLGVALFRLLGFFIHFLDIATDGQFGLFLFGLGLLFTSLGIAVFGTAGSFGLLVTGASLLLAAFTHLYNTNPAFKRFIDSIAGGFRDAYDDLTRLLHGLGDFERGVWDSTAGIREAFGDFFTRIRKFDEDFDDFFERWVDDQIVQAQVLVEGIGKELGKIPGLIETFGNNIQEKWLPIYQAIENAGKASITFVVDTVLNKGLIDGYNALIDLLHMPGYLKLDHIPWPPSGWSTGTSSVQGSHGGLDRGFAAGGYTGSGRRDQPAGIVHADEFVINAASRRKFEAERPGWLDELNRTGRLPGYALGGRVFNWSKDKVTSVASGVHDIVRAIAGGIASFLRHPKRFLLDMIKKAADLGGEIMDNKFAQVAMNFPTKAVDLLLGKLQPGIDEANTPTPGTGSDFTLKDTAAGPIAAIGEKWGASPIYPHIDPQGGKALDLMIGISQGNKLTNELVRRRAELGLRYAIHNMRIWSPVNWGGRPYTPISSSGDFRHIYHVHASFGLPGHGYAGGTMSASSGYAWVGERGPELVRFGGGERVYNTTTSNSIANGKQYTVQYGNVYTRDDAEFFRRQDRELRDFTLMANLRGA